MALRHAVGMGLHRHYVGQSHHIDQRRRRIFWTLYMLDRSIARTLGRPVGISDRDIDVKLPANIDIDIEDDEEIGAALRRDPGATPMSAAIHILRLSQIESKIYCTIYRVDQPPADQAGRKVLQLRRLLDEWKDDIAAMVPNTSEDEDTPNYYIKRSYHILQYHRAILLLLLPQLPQLSPASQDFQLCMSSAGAVGQLYKKLHDSQSHLSYSLIALHATFVAGLTLIYCFLADTSVYNLKLSSDIRACSTILYVISERWSSAREIRDAFERIIANTIEKSVVDLPLSPLHNDSMGQAHGTEALNASLPDDQVSDTTKVFWSELATIGHSQKDMHQLPADSLDTSMSISQTENIWNSLEPWFGEYEDLWLSNCTNTDLDFF
ncbi:putative transcriptional regulatory protein [Cyphellophora attinorum]|uniref:Putative transcriptional regulatory protein n=1 Tax=Cyphellophora attinorum TaxID=1664694 RepID=A0A0N1GZE2_9EURO|nr:putative transcriptional regulatory protein [Phialophora attinorum]KPI36506.1 putative transcriptional regulatory protein [Phialophora attinorum]